MYWVIIMSGFWWTSLQEKKWFRNFFIITNCLSWYQKIYFWRVYIFSFTATLINLVINSFVSITKNFSHINTSELSYKHWIWSYDNIFFSFNFFVIVATNPFPGAIFVMKVNGTQYIGSDFFIITSNLQMRFLLIIPKQSKCQ